MFLDQLAKEYTAEEKAIRADQAKRLLTDPMFDDALTAVEEDALRALVGTSDVDASNRARALITCVHGIKDHILSVIAEGPVGQK